MSTLSENKKVIQFLITLTVLCGLYYFWFSPNAWTIPLIGPYYGHFVHYTLVTLGNATIFLLGLLGHHAEIIDLREIVMDDTMIHIFIRNFCLGIDTMFLLTALIISYPGKWLDRLWFIPLGVLGIHIINIIRITGLCLSWIYFPDQSFIDHHDVYNVIAMIFIFGMFTIWVKRSGRVSKT